MSSVSIQKPLLKPMKRSSSVSRKQLNATPYAYSCAFCQWMESSICFITNSVYTPAVLARPPHPLEPVESAESKASPHPVRTSNPYGGGGGMRWNGLGNRIGLRTWWLLYAGEGTCLCIGARAHLAIPQSVRVSAMPQRGCAASVWSSPVLASSPVSPPRRIRSAVSATARKTVWASEGGAAREGQGGPCCFPNATAYSASITGVVHEGFSFLTGTEAAACARSSHPRRTRSPHRWGQGRGSKYIPSWLVAAPTVMSTSATHWMRASGRRSSSTVSSPVVTMRRLPRI